ncbi:squalene/phytoene synthase family protein [Sphingomonas sp.]|uniref:squalene/phytoene synthase family protein n=1 Tax=Sphingomonas sp. TaxID=28214 RepID=UPI0025EC6E79|nr:squalene/phytoene synthase family protein [Sphingomonas sp.]
MTAKMPAGGTVLPPLADPERALAVTYAPASLRPGLAAIFALDERLGNIVGTTTEPMIGLMRLAWWREALERLDREAAPAEPLLALLAEQALPHGITGRMLSDIEGGWAALIDGEEDVAARHGRERGASLFLAAARLLGASDDRLARAGEGWALADLAHRHSDEAIRVAARARAIDAAGEIRGGGWSRPSRPLAALAALVPRDAADPGPRRQGAPGRLARMLVRSLTGR